MKRRCQTVLLLLALGCGCASRSTPAGTWEHTQKDGEVVRGQFSDSEELFVQTRWLEDGTLTVSYSGGARSSCSLETVGGERHERCKSWYPNGQLSGELRLVDGAYDGPYSYWDERGELIRKGVYRDGKEAGVWVERDPTTGRLAEHNYDEGGRE